MKKKTVVYNKLIRDKIPEIVRADGWDPEIRVLNKKEYILALRKKILEEAKELNEGSGTDNLTEELADIQEIIYAILVSKNIKFSEFRKIQNKKRQKRGGFKKRLFLIKETKIKND